MGLSTRLQNSWSSFLLGITLVTAATLATVAAARGLDMEHPPLALFYAAVTLAAFFAGLWPAIIAAILSAVLIDLFLTQPTLTLTLSLAGADLLRVLAFLVVAVLIGIITEQRRRAVVSREESETRFHIMADAAPVLIWMSGPDKGGDYFNKPWLEFTGRTIEQEAGSGWMERVHPDDRETLQICQQAFNHRRPFEMEFRLRRHDGVYRWMLDRGTPRFSSTGQFQGYIGSCLDITERKMAEQSSTEREARLTAILETAVDGIITISDRGIIESANPAAERIFGYTRQEMIGQNVKMLMPDPDRAQHDQYLRNYLETGQAKIIGIGREVVGLRKDGSTFPLDLAVSEMKFSGRRMFTGLVRDVTVAKRVEQELHASRQRLELALEAGRMGAWDWDIQSNRITWSPTLEVLHGLPVGGFGGSFDDFKREIHPEDAEHVLVAIERSLDQRSDYHVEYRAIPPSGRIIWLEARGRIVVDEHGQPLRMAGVCMDITRRKQADLERSQLLAREQAARTEAELGRKRAAYLAEASEALVSSLDFDRTLKSVARLALPKFADACAIDLLEEDGSMRQVALAHVDPELERLGHELRRQYPPDPAQPSPLIDAMHSGRPALVGELPPYVVERYAHDATHLEGLRRFGIKSYIIAPLIARGRTLGAMVFITSAYSGREYTQDDLILAEELARRAAMAVENARLYQEAYEASQMKDEFLATVSHELRTPLNAILGWAQLLNTGRIDPAEMNEGLGVIERNAAVQAQLIADLLDVSRIITGRLRLDVRPLMLPEVIDAAVESVTPAARAKEISIHRRIDPEIGLVSGDPQRLQQVIWNLLSNSIKFTPRGGTVTVELTRKESQVQITIRDTGAGIAPEFLPHVFERFRQADASASRTHGGLGLGLAIVRHLVELHGGTVTAESAGKDQGAAFTVSLPVLSVHDLEPSPQAPALASGAPAAAARAPSLEGLRVLVVDDEPDARRLIRAVLQRCGAEVQTAASAEEAIEAITQNRLDVLVSDIGMPNEDGYSLIRRVRAVESTGARIPAVALTAYTRTEDRLRALSAGYQSHVVKPVDAAELAAVIASVTGRAI